MKIIHIMILAIYLSGCGNSNIIYNSVVDKNKTQQYYENKQCNLYIGPFTNDQDFNIDKFIEQTIKKANNEGLHGDSLINIKLKQQTYTAIFISQYCIYIQGNLIYSKK